MTDEQKVVAAEVAESMRQAAYKTVLARLSGELGEETAQKIMGLVAECAKQGLTEQQTLKKLEEFAQGSGDAQKLAPAVGIAANGLIYSKVAADVMSK